jgi:hypothetical protein
MIEKKKKWKDILKWEERGGEKKNSMLKKKIFRNVAVVIFQSVFHLEIY